jgi:hypothetical protein
MANVNYRNWSIGQLAAAIDKQDNKIRDAQTSLSEQIELREAFAKELGKRLQVEVAAGRRGASRASNGVAAAGRGPGRKLVDDGKVVAALKSHGKEGVASSELAKQFNLSGNQMSAILQRLAGVKKAKSNGKRGRGGRWWAS